MTRTRLTSIAVLLVASFALGGVVSAQGGAADGAVPSVVDPDGDVTQFLRGSSEDDRRVKELQRSARRNIQRSRWTLAIQNLKDLIALNPYDADYQLTLGLLFRKNNDLEEARRKFREYLDLGGGKAVAHLLIGESYAAGKDRDKVIVHLREAAESGLNLMKVADKVPSFQAYRTDTEFIKLALQLEKYELDVSELNDPLTDRFARTPEPGDVSTNAAQEGPSFTKKDQEETLRQAQICLGRIERALTHEDEERAMGAYKQLLDLTKEADRFTVPRLAAEFREIVGRKEEIESRIKEIRLKYHYREAQAQIELMRRAFKNRDYPRVDSLFQGLEDIARNMTKVDSDFREVSDRIVKVGRTWVERAQIRREFNAKPLSIQGIVLHRGDPVAIVNNQLLRVGDQFQGMKVTQVEPNQVYFDFRGERIPLVFRRF